MSCLAWIRTARTPSSSHQLARQEDARETAVSIKDRPPRRRYVAAGGLIIVGAQVPGVTRMHASGNLQADSGSGSEAMSHCVESKQDGSARFLRLQPVEPIAHIDGTPVLPHLTQADKEIGVRIVRTVHQLDDWVSDHLQRFIWRRTGKRQDIVSFLKPPVVAMSMDWR
jgi:hypothetical protein